jgi:hypothetical protein
MKFAVKLARNAIHVMTACKKLNPALKNNRF